MLSWVGLIMAMISWVAGAVLLLRWKGNDGMSISQHAASAPGAHVVFATTLIIGGGFFIIGYACGLLRPLDYPSPLLVF